MLNQEYGGITEIDTTMLLFSIKNYVFSFINLVRSPIVNKHDYEHIAITDIGDARVFIFSCMHY